MISKQRETGNPARQLAVMHGWIVASRNALLAITMVIVGLCLLPLSVSANTLTTPRTSTTLISEVKTIHAGDKFWVALHIQLAPGWHTYWVNAGDSGITPQLGWTLPNGFIAGPTVYLAPDREHVGPLVDYAYEKDAYYLVPITPPAILRPGTTTILSLKASWLVCKDICIPESGDLSLVLPAGDKAEASDDAPLMANLVGRLPMPINTAITFHNVSNEIHFDLPLENTGVTSDQVKTAVFFPESQQLIANASDQKVTVNPSSVSFAIGQSEGKIVDNASGVVSLELTNGGRRDYAVRLASESGAAQIATVETATPSVVTAAPIPPVHSAPVPEQVTLAQAVWYALIGGIILNCMPCVFPVLSLKALAVARKASAHPSEARKHGISYTAGVIISFLTLAFALVIFQQGGQAVGWGYQMQSPVFVSMLALLLFAVGLNLAGYFELPVVFGNVGAEGASKDNAWGSFLTGVLAVAVATPCTAPFMASAIGFALTQSSTAIFLVFGALGLGLSSPFLLVSFFPRLIRVLPKPGEWMNTFKELLSFPMFGWSAWLVWILAREAGPEAAFAILLGGVLITFAFWLWRRNASFLKLLSLIAAAGGIGLTVFAAHMPVVQASMPVGNDQMERFSPEKLAELRKDGKAVFVDATADWCLICKVNESTSLSTASVMKAFKDKHVAYLVADWTHGDAEITHYLESFGRSGVPIYVYYAPGGGAPVVLPQVLTPATVLEVLQ